MCTIITCCERRRCLLCALVWRLELKMLIEFRGRNGRSKQETCLCRSKRNQIEAWAFILMIRSLGVPRSLHITEIKSQYAILYNKQISNTEHLASIAFGNVRQLSTSCRLLGTCCLGVIVSHELYLKSYQIRPLGFSVSVVLFPLSFPG